MRVWAVSDIHTDYKKNMEWLEDLCDSKDYLEDVIIVAGDVSDGLQTLEKTLRLVASSFKAVFFVPGNHELWCRRQERDKYDSLGKLALITSLCDELGVHTKPACIEGVWIVPLLSWYHASWDKEPDVPGSRKIETVMTDFHACRWTSVPGLSPSDDSLARHFDSLNDPAFTEVLNSIREEEQSMGQRPPVISFSHFLPRQELLPEKRMLFIPNLAKAAGSTFLQSRISRLRPLAHVFGHTHFSWDMELEGVRYVQWPLGYPHEQSHRRDGGRGWVPIVLYDSKRGGPPPAAPATGRITTARWSGAPRRPPWPPGCLCEGGQEGTGELCRQKAREQLSRERWLMAPARAAVNVHPPHIYYLRPVVGGSVAEAALHYYMGSSGADKACTPDV